MPLRESEAIILRSYPMGEGDRLVSFLDRQAGRVRGVARGAMLPKSRFGSTLEVLSYIRIWYFERETRDLVRINQCELLESFLDVQRDYRAGIGLALISEITEAVLGEREVAETQFRLVLLTARAIRQYGTSTVVLSYFCLWTARLGGWLGTLGRCTKCQKLVEDQSMYVSLGFAELYCLECHEMRAKEVSKEGLEFGRLALSGSLERLFKLNHPLAASDEMLSYSLDILEQHIERKLITRKLLEPEEIG